MTIITTELAQRLAALMQDDSVPSDAWGRLFDALEAKDAKAVRDAALIREMDADLSDRNGVIAEQAKENRELRQRIAELEARTEQQPVAFGFVLCNHGRPDTDFVFADFDSADGTAKHLNDTDTLDAWTVEPIGTTNPAPAAQPVTVKLPDELTIDECNSAQDISYAHGWNMGIAQCEKELTAALHAAGIKIAEGE